VRDVLNTQNQRLLRGLQGLSAMIDQATIPTELEPYRVLIQDFCQQYVRRTEQNLYDLQLGQDMILEDILSNTQGANRIATLLSTRWAIPILRASDTDRLSLRIIGWMHQAHPLTATLPPAFTDGATSVWTAPVPIYFLPCIERLGFLYQPLLFHEFGHLLYRLRKPEMDALVGELQREIARCLMPPSRRNDRHSDEQARQRQVIVDTWYAWAQEIFCDAIGLAIGGPSFLLAFSTHLSMMERGDFYQSPADLRGSSHPVTWLRVQLLAERAQKLGLSDLAQHILNEWTIIADAMGVQEDYHGYFNIEISNEVRRIVDDMLVEVDPRWYLPEETVDTEWSAGSDSIVHLLNRAWQVYRTDPSYYPQWEKEMLNRFLA
jgi:hypothetical protein